jgi:ribosome-associated protein
MQKFILTEEYIHLNQLLKALAWCSNGAEANELIDNGLVKVNDEVELRRRNKIKKGFKIQFNNQIVIVE